MTALLSIGLAWQKISSDVPIKAEPAGAEASFHSFGGFCGEKEHIPLLKKTIDTLLEFLAIFWWFSLFKKYSNFSGINHTCIIPNIYRIYLGLNIQFLNEILNFGSLCILVVVFAVTTRASPFSNNRLTLYWNFGYFFGDLCPFHWIVEILNY